MNRILEIYLNDVDDDPDTILVAVLRLDKQTSAYKRKCYNVRRGTHASKQLPKLLHGLEPIWRDGRMTYPNM